MKEDEVQVITLELENGTVDKIKYHQGDDTEALAINFCEKHNLDEEVIPYIIDNINENLEQSLQARHTSPVDNNPKSTIMDVKNSRRETKKEIFQKTAGPFRDYTRIQQKSSGRKTAFDKWYIILKIYILDRNNLQVDNCEDIEEIHQNNEEKHENPVLVQDYPDFDKNAKDKELEYNFSKMKPFQFSNNKKHITKQAKEMEQFKNRNQCINRETKVVGKKPGNKNKVNF